MRRAGLGVAILAVTAVTAHAPVAGVGRAETAHEMSMVGNMEPFPDLGGAGKRNVRRARRLLRASRRTASRFDTLAEAERQGYRIKRRFRPGFTHLRKHAFRFWGKVFDPRAPQALIFWCPTRGRCTLTTYMYRAPGGPPPSTWGDLLQWHRHAGRRTAAWMTHVWLVPRVREGFATCAPMTALGETYGIQEEHYHSIEVDQPCPADDATGDDPGAMDHG